MPKKKKGKKKRKRKISSRIRSKPHKTTTPKGFFRSIGIKPFGKGDMELSDAEKAVEKLGRPDFIEAFRLAADEVEHDYAQSALMDFFHSDLDLVKIRYGTDFKSICSIATELQLIPVPSKSRILDIGGGPGHLAFWMANIWDDCTVTVADKYSDLGSKWALEIGQNRVDFVDATLPDLSPLQGQKFDIVVLSRVLSDILGELLPSGMDAFSIEEYFNSRKAKELIDKIEELLSGVDKVLASDGSVVVVESWSSPRILIMAKAFERKGLSMNIDLFSPSRVSIDYSVIVFSRSCKQSLIQNAALAVAVERNFEGEKYKFDGTVAECVRRLFDNSSVIWSMEYTSGDERGSVRNEVLEREGLALLYRTFTTGVRIAVLYPATEIPRITENLQKMEDALTAAGQGTIKAKYTAR